MGWFPLVMGMKFCYHYHTELNDSKQQDATQTYRNNQTEFTSDIKKNGIKVNLMKSNSPNNFYTG